MAGLEPITTALVDKSVIISRHTHHTSRQLCEMQSSLGGYCDDAKMSFPLISGHTPNPT